MLKRITAILAVCLSTFTFVGGAGAGPASSLEKGQLSALVKSFNAASQRKDVSLMVKTMPESLLKQMAARMGKTVPELKNSLSSALSQQFSKLPAGAYKLDAENIEYKETKDGHFYALVPTQIETQNTLMKFMTLAIYDNTKWHFIYGGQKTVQNSVFKEIYPYASDIDIPLAKVIKK